MDKWVTVGWGYGAYFGVCASDKSDCWMDSPTSDSCVLSVCCTTLQCCVLHHCGVQNNTRILTHHVWTLKKKMSWNQFDVRLLSSLARTQCAVGVAIRKTSYEPPPALPFLLLPCIIHSPPMSHPPIHWALANTLQPCTNFQSIKWSQLKPNRRKGQGNSQIWLTVGHIRCTGADLTLTMWKQQKPPFQW